MNKKDKDAMAQQQREVAQLADFNYGHQESSAAVRGEAVEEYQPGQWWLQELENHWGHGISSNDTKRAAKVACDFAAKVFSARAADALDSQPTARPTDDELWDATMRDRDAYHEWADKLADAIAAHCGVDIGEHSNQNLPWAEALEAIESADCIEERTQPTVAAQQGSIGDDDEFLCLLHKWEHEGPRARVANFRALCVYLHNLIDNAADSRAPAAPVAPLAPDAGPFTLEQRMPPKDVEVLIYVKYSDGTGAWRTDEWSELHEDPIGMGGPTICVGEGWLSYGDDNVTHWAPLLPAPEEVVNG